MSAPWRKWRFPATSTSASDHARCLEKELAALDLEAVEAIMSDGEATP